MLAGAIPIYHGDPEVSRYFNPQAMVLCHGKSFDAVVAEVAALNNSPELYLAKLRQPWFLNGKFDAASHPFLFPTSTAGSGGVAEPGSEAGGSSSEGNWAVFRDTLVRHCQQVAAPPTGQHH